MEIMKRGMFFSIDALIALAIIVLTLALAYPLLNEPKPETQLQVDILETLSALTIGEVNNSYAQSLIAAGAFTDTNKSILEAIGELYVTNTTQATLLAEQMLASLATKENIGIWYGNTLLTSHNNSAYESAEKVETARQVITGIQQGGSVTGFSARASLQSKRQTKYAYIGGYVGEGNLTIPLSFNGTAINATLEVAVDRDFDLYVNNNFAGSYNKSPSPDQPAVYPLSITELRNGTNMVELRKANLSIAGGFIRLTYESTLAYEQPTRYQFPGVEGMINIYDGIYIPTTPTTMKLFLRINSSNHTFFVGVGNKTVYNGSTGGQVQTITLENAYLASKLNYSELSRTTVPLRLGLENTTLQLNTTLDIISIIDSTRSITNSPGYLTPLKNAHYLLINATVASFSTTRLGIVGYRPAAPTNLLQPLTNQVTTLQTRVGSWSNQNYNTDNRDLCNGIDKAIDFFTDPSNPPSDGNATRIGFLMNAAPINHIAGQPCQGYTVGDLNGDGQLNTAADKAVYEACTIAHQQQEVVFYAVAFGENADRATLQAIVNCSGGEYYEGELGNLTSLYQRITQDILTRYQEQRINSVGGKGYTRLYADSYLEFNYTKPALPYGLAITLEKPFTNTTSATFTLPANVSIIGASVVSYSGPRWTNVVVLNNEVIFNLSSYGKDYIYLGDPYMFQLPVQLINQSNTLSLTTGVSTSSPSYPGSLSNKIIYTVLKNVSGYSPIVSQSEGCEWTIDFEDNTNITFRVPTNYTSTNRCTYQATAVSYNPNDATQEAVYRLMRSIDLNTNNKADSIFTPADIEIALSQVTGIPFTRSTEVQVRIWR